MEKSSYTSNLPRILAAVPGVLIAAANAPADSFTFQTLDNNNDPTFNQLLGINNSGTIAGYFGSGATGHPNQGYTLAPPYSQASYTNENFPGSVQTQVVGINSAGETVGFYADSKNNNFGFVDRNGSFTAVIDPNTPNSSPGTPMGINQLLGLNDKGMAVGFYVDANGNNHGYIYNIATASFKDVAPSGAVSTMATGVNNSGEVGGTTFVSISRMSIT